MKIIPIHRIGMISFRLAIPDLLSIGPSD